MWSCILGLARCGGYICHGVNIVRNDIARLFSTPSKIFQPECNGRFDINFSSRSSYKVVVVLLSPTILYRDTSSSISGSTPCNTRCQVGNKTLKAIPGIEFRPQPARCMHRDRGRFLGCIDFAIIAMGLACTIYAKTSVHRTPNGRLRLLS